MDKIFDDFFKQAKTGRIEINEFYYNIKIDSINKNIYPYLEEFISLFNIKSKDEIELKLVYLFSNITISDSNLILYIKKNIDFFRNKIEDKEYDFLDYKINLNIIEYYQETPYALKITITDGFDKYELPLVSFGISNDTCYIYAVQDKNKDKTSKFSKKIKRLLYKINTDLIDSKEYNDYKNGVSDYYPENITDVSVSAILSLALLLRELTFNNINKVKVISYLPMRYYAKELANQMKYAYYLRKNNLNEDKSLKEKYDLEQLRIQNNLTQKLLRNFFRLMFHFDNIKLESYPFELDETLNLKIEEFENDFFNKLGLEKNIKSR